MGQEFLRGGKPLVAGSAGRHPVAYVRQGVVLEHEAVGVERVARQAGRGAGEGGVEWVGGVHQRVSAFQAARVVDAAGAVAGAQVGGAVVAQAIGVAA